MSVKKRSKPTICSNICFLRIMTFTFASLCILTVWISSTQGRDGPSSNACAPVFHSRYGMWTDPCHAVVHVARNWHVNLKCSGPLRISIVGAKYGPLCKKVDASNTCKDPCQSASVVESVRQICGSNGVFECRVSVKDNLFVNPCPEIPPILAVSFTCDFPVYNFYPRTQKKQLELRQWGGGFSSTCECGGDSFDGRKKRALFGSEDLAVWSNTASAIEFFNSTYDVLQFSGIFGVVDTCSGVTPTTTPSAITSRPINSCVSFNSAVQTSVPNPTDADTGFTQREINTLDGTSCPCSFQGQVLYSNATSQLDVIPQGVCRTLQQVSIARPCACGATPAASQCFRGERCCSYQVEPFCTITVVPNTTVTPITTTIPITTTVTPLAVTSGETQTNCLVSVGQTAMMQPSDPAGQVTAAGGTPPYIWSITSTDGNFLIGPSSGSLTVNEDKYLNAGTYSITVLVRDAAGNTAQRQINIQACATTTPSYARADSEDNNNKTHERK